MQYSSNNSTNPQYSTSMQYPLNNQASNMQYSPNNQASNMQYTSTNTNPNMQYPVNNPTSNMQYTSTNTNPDMQFFPSDTYFRAITIFTGLDNITRLDTSIFSAPNTAISFGYAQFFVHNKGNQLQGVFYDPHRFAIQKWQNGINQGVIYGDPNLVNF